MSEPENHIHAGNRAEAGQRPRLIALLPETLKNQIAAGEVVERPSSVIKELAENSLDAGADRVDATIERGGQGLILVQDNGVGIPGDQLELAVTRHATSKIETVRDLFAIQSFGFRGEALASVASVSRMTLTSRSADEGEAHFIEIRTGEIVDRGPAALPGGTRVEVRDLFLGVPARLKFLKTESTEARKCKETLFRLSLAHLGAGFSLTSNSKSVFRLSPGETLAARLGHFWPPSQCESMREFAYESEGRSVRGLAGSPAAAQARPDHMLFYVNDRPVQDRMLMRAAREAYKGRLLSKEHPQLVLFLDLPAREVDVNVHPAKTEVRFIDEKAVFSLVRRGVLQALMADDFSPHDRSGDGTGAAREGVGPLFAQPSGHAALLPRAPRPQAPGARPGSLFDSGSKFSTYREYKASTPDVSIPDAKTPDGQTPANQAPPYSEDFRSSVLEPAAHGPARPDNRYAQAGEDSFPDMAAETRQGLPRGMVYLGQIARTYLAVRQGEDALVLVDQHAAHERVLFEKMRRDRGRGDSRPLAAPLGMSLHASEGQRLDELWRELARLGFRIERESPESCSITGVPPYLEPGKALEYLRAALGDRSKGVEDLWIMMSCRAALKAGASLAVDEALALLEEWLRTPNKEYCPHGRPTVLVWDGAELEKMFKRRG